MIEEKETLVEDKEKIDDSIEIEEEPLEEENEATLTMEAPIVPIENHSVSLKSDTNEIVNRIATAETVDELKEYVNLFHLSLAKKEASRALTQSELVDLLLDQAGERIKKRPDEMSNKDILDYLHTFQDSIDKSSKTLETKIVEAPPLTLNQTHQEINININDGKSVSIDDDARLRILEVINALTKGTPQQKTIQQASEEVVVTPKEEKESKQ